MAEGRAGFIESDGEVGGLELIKHLEQHESEAVNGANDLAGLRDGERRARAVLGGAEGVVRPVDDSVAVEEDEEGFFHELIITPFDGLRARGVSLKIENQISKIKNTD
jgi:hypothetical protein